MFTVITNASHYTNSNSHSRNSCLWQKRSLSLSFGLYSPFFLFSRSVFLTSYVIVLIRYSASGMIHQTSPDGGEYRQLVDIWREGPSWPVYCNQPGWPGAWSAQYTLPSSSPAKYLLESALPVWDWMNPSPAKTLPCQTGFLLRRGRRVAKIIHN